MSKTLSRVLIDDYDGQWETFPNATDSLEDYDNIIWSVDSPPSKSDLKSKGVFETSAARQSDLKAKVYVEKRKRAYPDIGDQLDDLYKKGAFSDDMAAKLKKVKDDNPKG